MKTSINLSASLVHSAWSAISTLIATPILLKTMGPESYGLVGFYLSTFAIVQILDAGLAPALNREVAIGYAKKDYEKVATVLGTLSPVYWILAVLIGGTIYLLAPSISTSWLTVSKLELHQVTTAISLIGLIIAARWPVAAYLNSLYGLQKQATASLIGIIFVTAANIGGICVVIWIAPNIVAYFIWQAICALLFTLALRHFAWRAVGTRKPIKFELDIITNIWKFSLGMTGISIATILLTQLDKILMSRLLTLESYAHYMLAVILASGIYVLLTPTLNVIYPKFSSLVANKNISEIEKFYQDGTRILCSFLFPLAFALAIYSREILNLWTGDPSVAQETSFLLALLVMGIALNGVMHFPYALQLANGDSSMALRIVLLLTFIFVPLLLLFVFLFGVIGAGLTSLSVNLVYLFWGGWLTHKKYLKRGSLQWIIGDVVPQILISFALIFGLKYLFNQDENLWLSVCIAAFSALLALTINLLLMARGTSMDFVYSLAHRAKEPLKNISG